MGLRTSTLPGQPDPFSQPCVSEIACFVAIVLCEHVILLTLCCVSGILCCNRTKPSKHANASEDGEWQVTTVSSTRNAPNCGSVELRRQRGQQYRLGLGLAFL
jgi:hypothetical protein